MAEMKGPEAATCIGSILRTLIVYPLKFILWCIVLRALGDSLPWYGWVVFCLYAVAGLLMGCFNSFVKTCVAGEV